MIYVNTFQFCYKMCERKAKIKIRYISDNIYYKFIFVIVFAHATLDVHFTAVLLFTIFKFRICVQILKRKSLKIIDILT